MAIRFSNAAAERCSCSGRGVQPASIRPVLCRQRQTLINTSAHFSLANRLRQTPAQRNVLAASAISASSLAVNAPVNAQPQQTDALSEKLDFPRALTSFAAVATVVAVCSFVAAAFPSTGSLFASVSFTALEASKGAHLVAAKSAWAGLAAGFLHTLCGPDHLAALTPLTIGRDRTSASLLGALWGFGHSTGQLILGLFFVLLKERFNNFLPALSKWAGVIVGLTLLAIGALGIYETVFEHGEEEEAHGALAMAGADGSTVSAAAQQAKFGLATYATGIVYGLQPDALFVVIPALALPTKMAAIAYCTMFVVGTVTAMGGYTLLIGTTSQAIIKQKPWLQAHLSTIASAVAIVVGSLVLAAGLGFSVPFFG